MNLEKAALALMVAYISLDQYVFRFQRTTRGIAQLLSGGIDKKLQLALTPSWVGVLGWINKGLALATGIVMWKTWGWIALGAFAFYVFVLGTLVDLVSLLPTYKHCFRIIKRSLEIDGQQDLLNSVRSVEANYLGGQGSR
jgi:hypothetical protein